MKVGLVLEGGGMRGMYTAGVLDTFLDQAIEVDEIVGVSAGALFGVNYVSKQKERSLRYNIRFAKNKNYMSLKSYIKTGNYINEDFAFYKIPLELDKFDAITFKKNDKGFFATVTNVETGEAEYIPFKDEKKDIDILRASGAIPYISKIVDINGGKYLDGGIADSIPIEFLKKKGYKKIIVVLTRDKDYQKKPMSKILLKMIKRKYKDYPKFVKAMETRYKRYNEMLQRIVEMEKNNEIFVIRPSEPIPIKQLERNPEKLQRVYDMGVKDCNQLMSKMKNYISSKKCYNNRGDKNE